MNSGWVIEHRSPETRVWYEILRRGLQDLLKQRNLCKTPAQVEEYRLDAEEWVRSEDNAVGTFRFICDILGFDRKALRDRVLSDGFQVRI